MSEPKTAEECQHLKQQMWEPHLAGARKCYDCGMVYNPNHTPNWFFEPPSLQEQIAKLTRENAAFREVLDEIVNGDGDEYDTHEIAERALDKYPAANEGEG